MWLIAIVVCLVVTFYVFVKQRLNYFEKRGIPTPESMFLFGHLWSSIVGTKSWYQVIIGHYNKIKNVKYMGFYNLLKPTVFICDPELIGDIMIKDFHHFADNELVADENVDYILAKNIFSLKGHKWKSTRALITPMFSSGKLKYIFPLVNQVATKMITYVNNEIQAGHGSCLDGKDLCNKFNIDNIATCAYGLNGQAFEGKTKFNSVAQILSDMSLLGSFKASVMFVFPELNRYLKLKLFKDEMEKYLTTVLEETIQYRRDTNLVRNDFLDHLSSLKEKATEYPFTDRDLVAQAAGFFIDGVVTSSSIMAYTLYEIANKPKIQEKIREEINRIKAAPENELTYEEYNELHYLDAVVHESIRLNGPGSTLFKVCTKSYTLPEVSSNNNARLVLNPGDSVMIPSDAIHRDPQYYPEPDVFKPERFLPDNKGDLTKHTFIGFGQGPRQCIGMRFGLMQVKMAIAALVSNFKIELNDKMLPMEVHPFALFKTPRNGFYFHFERL